ncbi:MAG: molybdopterin molybdotransferase MoeA [Chloroflexi bacterium]|jgi:molybdopterin molybdotransferase|nr:molybdopterin molybdotransferase MoeA [Chloroflexota bacterium]
MPEFFEVLPPNEARAVWLAQVSQRAPVETVAAVEALGRVTAQAIYSPEALPAFPRSTVDGYAVRAADTFGASDSLPAYLRVAGEVRMGQAAPVAVGPGAALLIHTGGMLPSGADAVVMVEHTQPFGLGEIEILRAVAPGENVLQVGEDVVAGSVVLPAGHRIQPQDIGALLALGLVDDLAVRSLPRMRIFSTGDELVPPAARDLKPGQIRDINSGTIRALCLRAGAEARSLEIVPDDADALYTALAGALPDADLLVITAGSSVSARDMTAEAINRLGAPGVLVHGVAARPGKPTILAVVDGKPVIGLPGNPVSAMVMFSLFGVPAIAHLLDAGMPLQVRVAARVAANVPSAAGREDYVPVRLVERDGEQWAEPVFGKSNLIFTLVGASGLLKVPLNLTGLRAGAWGEVILF